MRFQKDFGFIVEEYCYCLLCQQCHSGWQGHTRKEEGFVLRYFLHEKKKERRESTPNLFCPICSFCQVASYISRSRFQHPWKIGKNMRWKRVSLVVHFQRQWTTFARNMQKSFICRKISYWIFFCLNLIVPLYNNIP